MLGQVQDSDAAIWFGADRRADDIVDCRPFVGVGYDHYHYMVLGTREGLYSFQVFGAGALNMATHRY